MIEADTRVALRRGGWEGRVMLAKAGRVQVAFDNGGSGIFAEDEVRVLADEGKSWPPRLEGKDLPRC